MTPERPIAAARTVARKLIQFGMTLNRTMTPSRFALMNSVESPGICVTSAAARAEPDLEMHLAERVCPRRTLPLRVKRLANQRNAALLLARGDLGLRTRLVTLFQI